MSIYRRYSDPDDDIHQLDSTKLKSDTGQWYVPADERNQDLVRVRRPEREKVPPEIVIASPPPPLPPPPPPPRAYLDTDTRQASETAQFVPPGVNGVWDSGQSKNLTVHLDLDIEEDLGQDIDHFCCFYKMGSFAKARAHFDENLADHLDKPYIFVMYAEMLFRQGSYHEICELDGRTMREITGKDAEQSSLWLLKEYWELILLMAQVYTTRRTSLPRQKIKSLRKHLGVHMTNTDESVGSIEVGMICRLLEARSRIRSSPPDNEYDSSYFWESDPTDDQSLEKLYDQLSCEGRVWDMHDLLEAIWRWRQPSMIEFDLKSYSRPEKLGQLINYWDKFGQHDSATNLALLDLVTANALSCLYQHNLDELDRILDHANPLAISLTQGDVAHTKSRGYTQWIIAKTCSIAFRNPEFLNHQALLRSSTGVTIVSSHFLPVYVPVNSENPGWYRSTSSLQITNAMKLAVNNARDLGDYNTESLALMCLTMISSDPALEFEELYELQNLVQGDIGNYLNTVLSSYLISDSEQSKLKIKANLEEQISRPEFKERFSPDKVWQANMIFRALEKQGSKARQSMKDADESVRFLSSHVLGEIEAKTPDFRRQARQRLANPESGSEHEELDEEQVKLDEDKKRIESRQSELDKKRRDINAQQTQTEIEEDGNLKPGYVQVTDEIGLVVDPSFWDHSKILLSVEDLPVEDRDDTLKNSDDAKNTEADTETSNVQWPRHGAGGVQTQGDPSPLPVDDSGEEIAVIEVEVDEESMIGEGDDQISEKRDNPSDHMDKSRGGEDTLAKATSLQSSNHTQPYGEIKRSRSWKVSKAVLPHRTMDTKTAKATSNVHFEADTVNTQDQVESVGSRSVPENENRPIRPVPLGRSKSSNSNEESQKEILKEDAGSQATGGIPAPLGEESLERPKLTREPSTTRITRRSTAPTVEDVEDDDTHQTRQSDAT